MLWSEAGENESGIASDNWSVSSRGGWINTKERRFVVVKQRAPYVKCVPITTHDGRGAGPPHVKAYHAIVYTTREPPEPEENERPSEGEPGMQPIPIKVDSADGRGLVRTSRLNLAAVQTVHFKSQVRFIGNVARSSVGDLLDQLSAVDELE